MQPRASWAVRHWAWALLVAGVAAMTPGLLERVRLEGGNATYELAMEAADYESLRGLGGSGLAAARLTDAGLASVAIDMATIGDLEADGRLSVLSWGELVTQLEIADQPTAGFPHDGTYVTVTEADLRVERALRRGGPITSHEIGGLKFLRVGEGAAVRDLVVGFDHTRMARLAEDGLDFIVRLSASAEQLESQALLDELAHVATDFGVRRVIFSGRFAPFAQDIISLTAVAEGIRGLGFDLVLVDIGPQTRDAEYYATINRAVKLHALDLSIMGTSVAADRAVRAITERSVRIILLRPTVRFAAEHRLEQLTAVLAEVQDRAPDGYRVGVATRLPPLLPSAPPMGGAIATVAAMAALAAGRLSRGAAMLAAIAVATVGVLWWATGADAIGDQFRLGTGILGATVAALTVWPRRRLGPALLEYGKASIMVLVAGLALAGLAYEDRFLIGAEDFFGVKALLVTPLGIAAAYALYRSAGRPNISALVNLMRSPLRLWHLVTLGIGVFAVWYLVIRSGNSGLALDWELAVRQALENLLSVRPRTKELLIGFPALIAGIMLAARTPRGWWLIAVGAVGTASALDTFAHFHTPLAISVTRTAYSVGLGLVVGLVAIGVATLVARRFGPLRQSG